MSARKGWVFDDPPPPSEWHMPAWVREKDTGHSHFLSAVRRPRPTEADAREEKS